ncbi:MAG: peptide chain release factor N(5)-glutamine methyltransferase [[Eubacterium] sulci]|jgi:protein-(glutamine-N5) methyltransferase, release factor-specific|nr:peptide chain release factor N(5)-glutamine methyltransferase [[Eubacterium] sulci]MBF1176250.1 peptide chain release factor N(5)-glutamine methyltransferase [[Eubacterium] sulci]MBF1181506.1 peptide chain release factor N(5)-glutamine methyltransferase [[Eubacterium] sulci]MBF1186724.1 peptide chain release factor N(5)-glutamine methyltransferase [[Eubacterium] sulci]
MSLLVKEMLTMGEKQLMDSDIADATRDCKILYCYMMDIPFSKIILEYQEVLQDRLCDKYFELIDRRSKGEPVQYIMGSQEFMGLEFIVNENVLIPRQDTETLVEDALEIINTGTLRGEDMDVKRKEWDILDLCTGSGAIGVSLARIANKVNVTCSDISEGAIKVAKENAQKHGVAKSVKFEQGDLFKPFSKHFRKQKFDMIISNPPYIKSSIIPTLQKEVCEHEPLSALDGGESGLDFYERIVSGVGSHLRKSGVLLLEIGHDQGEAVSGLLSRNGEFTSIRVLKDLANRDRIVFAKKSK